MLSRSRQYEHVSWWWNCLRVTSCQPRLDRLISVKGIALYLPRYLDNMQSTRDILRSSRGLCRCKYLNLQRQLPPTRRAIARRSCVCTHSVIDCHVQSSSGLSPYSASATNASAKNTNYSFSGPCALL